MAALRTSALIASAHGHHVYIGFHCMEGVPSPAAPLARGEEQIL